MSNPSGVNSFTPYAPEPAYGDITKQKDLAQAAPVAGAAQTAQATNAPRRDRKAAARPQGQPQPSAQPTPQAQAGLFWQQAAALPGASPLVQQLAQEASRGLPQNAS